MSDEPPPADRALLARASRPGPEGWEAFEALVRPHLGWLGRTLLVLLGDPGLADDALQETLLRAHAHLGRLRDPRALRSWLRSIATRTAFNLRRAERTRASYHERAGAPPVRFADVTPEAVETRQALFRVLDRLPYPYREVLVLRYVEEMSPRAIARQLGIRESAAKMRVSRARRAFLARWREEVGDAP